MNLLYKKSTLDVVDSAILPTCLDILFEIDFGSILLNCLLILFFTIKPLPFSIIFSLILPMLLLFF